MILIDLTYLLSAIVILISFLFIMFVYLLVRKTFEIRWDQKLQSFMNSHQQKMFAYLSKGDFYRQLIPNSELSFSGLEKLLRKFSNALNGDDVKERVTIYAETFLAKYYLLHLKSKTWSKRMNALFHIDNFRVKSLEQELIVFYESNRLSKAEKLQVYKILASFSHPKLFAYITKSKDNIPDLTYREILMRLSTEDFIFFLTNFYQSSLQLQYSLIDTIGITRNGQYLVFLESLLEQKSIEFRIRSLKAISQIGMMLNADKLLLHKDSEHWQVRMMTAKCFGALRRPQYAVLLRAMFSDPSWWVRQQAGQSLLVYPDAMTILEKMLEEETDNYALDLVRECLERGRKDEVFI